METAYNALVKSLTSLTIMALVVCGTNSVFAQEKEPPAPKEPVSNLIMPKPVKSQELRGRAKLPEQLKLGFALDLAEKILPGNWDFKGHVSAIDAEKVTFTTDQGQTGNLIFRLPEGFQLSLVSGDAVSIKRKTIGYSASLGYELVVASSEKLVSTSGRLFSDSAQEVSLWDGLTLEQSQELGQVLSRSEYETIYQVPVTLSIDGRETQLIPGEASEVVDGGKTYRIMVQESSRIVPTREYEGVAEGSGYVLEYVAVPK